MRVPKSILEPEFYIKFVELLGVLATVSTLISICLLPASIPMVSIYSRDRNDEARAMAAKALLHQNALEALPEILEGSLYKAWSVQEECRETLHSFLPQINEANQDVMPANSETLLSRIILTTYDIKHGTVIVDYLEKFGQGSSRDAMIKHLRELCGDYGGSLTELEAYKAKVENLLAILRERQNQNNTRQELLRHSSIPTTQANQLLRPAADSQTAPVEQLLRASNSIDSE